MSKRNISWNIHQETTWETEIHGITPDTGVTNCWSLAGCDRCVLIEDTVLGGWEIIDLEPNSRFLFCFVCCFVFLAILSCFKNSWARPESTLPMSINIPRGEREAWGWEFLHHDARTRKRTQRASPGFPHSIHTESCWNSLTLNLPALLNSL